MLMFDPFYNIATPDPNPNPKSNPTHTQDSRARAFSTVDKAGLSADFNESAFMRTRGTHGTVSPAKDPSLVIPTQVI